MYKALMALKTRNSVVVAPHPSAAKCSLEAAKIIHDAAVRAGAPKDIIQFVIRWSSDIGLNRCDW